MSDTALQTAHEAPLAQPAGGDPAGVTVAPRVDVLETENELLLVADLPGVRPEGIDLRFENGELHLHGRREPRHADKRPVAWEREPVSFQRVFRVTEKVDASAITAELRHGVLTLRLPKTEAARPRRIAVKGD